MNALLRIEYFYWLGGLWLLAFAVRIAANRGHPRRLGSSVFWGVLGVLFVAGRSLPPVAVGYAVVGLAVLAATGRVAAPAGTRSAGRGEREAEAARLRNRIFLPALLIPATAIAGSLLLARMSAGGWVLASAREASLVALCLGTLAALAAGMRLTRCRRAAPVVEGARLMETIGWIVLLPQMLAALGGVFAKAGVGEAVASLVVGLLPAQTPFVAVAAYCLGMALFTVCTGNAFAAFAVITGGIGLPLVVQRHGGNPAIMAAIGMLSGYCGTLVTPMAANFNLVPAMLLELPDRNAVIRAQWPLAAAIFAANLVLMYFCVYRF